MVGFTYGYIFLVVGFGNSFSIYIRSVVGFCNSFSIYIFSVVGFDHSFYIIYLRMRLFGGGFREKCNTFNVCSLFRGSGTIVLYIFSVFFVIKPSSSKKYLYPIGEKWVWR